MGDEPGPQDAAGVPAPAARHLVVSGTGRAGTSFLVQFLGACGLDIGPDHEYIDDRVRAGIEHRLLEEDAPYVVKDPWLFVYCDKVDLTAVGIDALVVPVRDLLTAATSRVIQERMARADTVWRDWPASDLYGTVPGGVVYSIDAVDEARLLAVGFHRLVQWSTANAIPLVLLDFPRAVQDAEYLIRTLRPWLPADCSDEAARTAFESLADGRLLRAERWTTPGGEAGPAGRPGEEEWERLDREAFAELLRDRTADLTVRTAEVAHARKALEIAEDQLREATRWAREAGSELEQVQGRLAQTEGQLAAERERARVLDAEVEAIRRTMSWRLTRPLRRLRSARRRRPTPGEHGAQ